MSRVHGAAALVPLLITTCYAQPPGFTTTRDVVFGRAGTRELHLDIDQPANPGAKMPVIVYIHGGAFKFGSYHGPENHPLAAAGFFCVNVEYRLSGEAIWPAQIYDCKAAIRWLRANAAAYHLDVDRIGVWGHSAGGQLAALIGTSGDVPELEGDSGNPGFSTKVACVVDGFGPTNFLRMVAEPGIDRAAARAPASELLGKPIEEVPELVKQADPCTYVKPGCPPFLIQHGTADMVVPFSQSTLLFDTLIAAGADVTLHAVGGAGHGFSGADPSTHAALNAEVMGFFRQHLRARP
jgi:acetyl esterase/lipase